MNIPYMPFMLHNSSYTIYATPFLIHYLCHTIPHTLFMPHHVYTPFKCYTLPVTCGKWILVRVKWFSSLNCLCTSIFHLLYWRVHFKWFQNFLLSHFYLKSCFHTDRSQQSENGVEEGNMCCQYQGNTCSVLVSSSSIWRSTATWAIISYIFINLLYLLILWL